MHSGCSVVQNITHSRTYYCWNHSTFLLNIPTEDGGYSRVCGRVSFALQRSPPALKSVGGLQCVCVRSGGGCLIKFTWVYLWDSSSAVLWLQGEICSSPEMLQCHLRDSKGQNSLWFGWVRCCLPPTQLLVSLLHRWELPTADSEAMQCSYKAAVQLKISLSVVHLLLCGGFSGSCFLAKDAPFRRGVSRNLNLADFVILKLIIKHAVWSLCSLPVPAFGSFVLSEGTDCCLRATTRVTNPLRADSLQSANWHATAVSSANFQVSHAHGTIAPQWKNLTNDDNDRGWRVMLCRTMGKSVLFQRLSPRANKSLLYSDLLQCVI